MVRNIVCLFIDFRKEKKRKVPEIPFQNLMGFSFEVQTNQIFLGMVAMQYEACMDMVQLIEQLDQACIRFVHFSKENELRSRVFSEKMGLESGWNCHISLRPLTEEEKLEEEREEREQSLFTQRSSDILPDSVHFYCTSEVDHAKKHHHSGVGPTGNRRPTLNEIFGGSKRPSLNDSADTEDPKFLPRCSASVPEMVMLSRTREPSLDPEERQRLLEIPSSELDELDHEVAAVCDTSVVFNQHPSGSESSITPRSSPNPNTTNRNRDGGDQDSVSLPSPPGPPIASSTLKEKESVIRFADSVDDSTDGGDNHHHHGTSSLRVTESFNRQRNLTPTESYNDAYEMAENKTPLGYDMSNRVRKLLPPNWMVGDLLDNYFFGISGKVAQRD